MALILDMGPDGNVGEILHPLMANKWRLGSWYTDTLEHNNILTLQVIEISVEENSRIFKKNSFSVVFEEDNDAGVARAVDALKKSGKGTIDLEFLGDVGQVLKRVRLHDVKIKHHYFSLSYAYSETVKAHLTGTFKKIELI